MQPKSKNKAALRAVSEYYSDAINETSSAYMPRVEQTGETNERNKLDTFFAPFVY